MCCSRCGMTTWTGSRRCRTPRGRRREPRCRSNRPDTATHEQLYGRTSVLINRRPLRIPLPDFLTTHGTRLADALDLAAPFAVSRLIATDRVAKSTAQWLLIAPSAAGMGMKLQ